MDDNQKYISHYGIPGMRWGIRKATSFRDKRIKNAQKMAKKRQQMADGYSQSRDPEIFKKAVINKKAAESWLASKKALMNMKITDTTTKNDILKQDVNAFMNRYNNMLVAYNPKTGDISIIN